MMARLHPRHRCCSFRLPSAAGGAGRHRRRGRRRVRAATPTSKSVDTPVPRLVGRNPAEIEAAMQAFRTGQKPASGDGPHRQGLLR